MPIAPPPTSANTSAPMNRLRSLADGPCCCALYCTGKEVRPLTTLFVEPVNLHLLNILWSDPSDSDALMKLGVHGNERGNGIVEFGADVTAEFCHRNGIDLVIRSHQYVREGFKVRPSSYK